MEQLVHHLNKELGTMCRTFLIGLELNDNAKRDMRLLDATGGDAFEFYNVNTVQIEEVFDRIEVSLGLRKRALIMQRGNQALIAEQNYVKRRASSFFPFFSTVSSTMYSSSYPLRKGNSFAYSLWIRVVPWPVEDGETPLRPSPHLPNDSTTKTFSHFPPFFFFFSYELGNTHRSVVWSNDI